MMVPLRLKLPSQQISRGAFLKVPPAPYARKQCTTRSGPEHHNPTIREGIQHDDANANRAFATHGFQLRSHRQGFEIDLRPLTVFVGPSNTGKSYLAILIYALHRFFSRYVDVRDFGFELMPPFLSRVIREQQPIDVDSVRRLVDWIRDVSVQVEAKSPSDSFSCSIARFYHVNGSSLIQPISSNFSEVIAEEMGRSFGIEDTAKTDSPRQQEGCEDHLVLQTFCV